MKAKEIKTKRRKTTQIDPGLIKKTTDFHGHWCPGLAIGIRVADYVVERMGRASDEEIVAVVETDMCAVDAIQYITGCTFGKGNLIYKDYGKNAFTFYRRRDGKAIRIVTRDNIFGCAAPDLARLNQKKREEGLTRREEKEWHEMRQAISERVMESDFSQLFEIKGAAEPVPKKARMLSSITCESCNEPVMETRIRRFHGQSMCIPCFEAVEKR